MIREPAYRRAGRSGAWESSATLHRRPAPGARRGVRPAPVVASSTVGCGGNAAEGAQRNQQCEAQPPVLRAPDETADRTIDPSASRHQNQQKTSYMPRHARSGEALAEPSKAPGDRLKHLQTVLSIP